MRAFAFMHDYKSFRHLSIKYGKVADFLTIYIEEAHPVDGWNHRNSTLWSHKTLEDRLAAARQLFQDNSDMSIVVDSMSNSANFAYGGLYERLYIIMSGRIVYEGKRGPEEYRLKEVESWLQKFSS